MLQAPRGTVCLSLILLFPIILGFTGPTSAGDAPVDSAPVDVQSLLDAGGVAVETYDPATERSDLENYHGSAMFEMGFAAPFRSEFEWKPDGKWKRVTVKTTFQPLDAKIRLKIKVPVQKADEDFWNGPLMRHELDHVAICADPRPAQIFERTLRSVSRMELKVSARSEPKSSGIVARVEHQLKLRREAVYELIRRQNRKLDDLTRHGALAVADRDVFFRELYEVDSLDDAEFPFMADVMGLLREKSYQEAKLLYLVPVVE